MDQVITQINSTASALRNELGEVLMKMDSPSPSNRLECRIRISKLRETVPGTLNKAAAVIRQRTPPKRPTSTHQVMYGTPKKLFVPKQTGTADSKTNSTDASASKVAAKEVRSTSNSAAVATSPNTTTSQTHTANGTPVLTLVVAEPREPLDFSDSEGIAAADMAMEAEKPTTAQVKEEKEDAHNTASETELAASNA